MADLHEPHRIRPYARLLTMLGEQLIKNDRIALVELVKNCYDADATQVTIAFENFGQGLVTKSESRIVVTDNGDGMDFSTVANHWLNPATNIKERRKRTGLAKTPGGRVIQGEKGIGRFAMFKLGSLVALATRARGADTEVTAELDISFLDPTDAPLATTKNLEKQPASPMFLDEVVADIAEREPTVFITPSLPHGTQLSIGRLRSSWSMDALEALHEDLLRLRPLTSLLTGAAGTDPLGFEVRYTINGAEPEGLESPESILEDLAPRAVLNVVGSYESDSNSFSLLVNNEQRSVSVASSDFTALDLYARHFGKDRPARQFTCGDFSFEFLVFDIRPNADTVYQLDPMEKQTIKEHRIYLYRDGVRVLPYGDPDDDWLQLDKIRGTVGANRVLSNDQTVGFVYITQKHNPDLRDKTNREGLIDSGAAYTDFLALLQLLINYLRKGDFARHLLASERRRNAKDRRQIESIDGRIQELLTSIAQTPTAKAVVTQLADAWNTERRVMRERLERTEDLAGVGLSVETASHDVVASANQALRDATVLDEQVGNELGRVHELAKRAHRLVLSLSFIVTRLQDVQGLFVSSRGSAKNLDAVQYMRKIQTIYSRALSDAGITVLYEGDHKLILKSHPATLLQVFLNLVDNAIYWLKVEHVENPTITVTASQSDASVVFRDNGPGIAEIDLPYIFDPFFSGRGDAGRGLGLYIARQVAHRDRLNLDLVSEVGHKPGRVPATFRLSVSEE